MATLETPMKPMTTTIENLCLEALATQRAKEENSRIEANYKQQLRRIDKLRLTCEAIGLPAPEKWVSTQYPITDNVWLESQANWPLSYSIEPVIMVGIILLCKQCNGTRRYADAVSSLAQIGEAIEASDRPCPACLAKADSKRTAVAEEPKPEPTPQEQFVEALEKLMENFMRD